MPKVYCVLLLLASVKLILGVCITDGTKLISTFLVHRHGDRTPTKSSLKYSTNLEALKAASARYGYGQLTESGMRRSYELGKFFRSRYDELLSPRYNRSEIYIRSTDYTRTKMTILIAMAAVYTAYPGSWSEEIKWVPTPYTTVRLKYDFLSSFNCPVLNSAKKELINGKNPRMSKFVDVLNVISEETGINITSSPALVYSAYDLFISQQSMGVPLSNRIEEILPDIKAATDVAIDIIFGNRKYLALQAGVLLNDFFIYTAKQINGTATPRVRIYSAHDVTVYSLEAVAQITPRQGVPKYNSAFALELRQVEETGEYVVLPIYLPSPNEDLVYFTVEGCDSVLCPYDTYKEIVSPYLLEEVTWRTVCGFTEDLVVEDPCA